MQSIPLSKRFGTVVSPSGQEPVGSLNRDEIIGLLKSSGAVYFSGFNIDLPSFRAFTDLFSNDYMDNTGSGSYRKTSDASGDGTIQSVSYVYDARGQRLAEGQRLFGLPLHADRSYVKSQPVLTWFLCARPASSGGETTVCDGILLYQALSERTKNLFAEKRLKYIRHYPSDQWPVLFHTDDLDKAKQYCAENDLVVTAHDDGSLTTEFVKPAVVKTLYGGELAFVNSILIQLWQEDELGRINALVRLEDGSKIPAEVIEEIKEVAEGLTVNLPWKKGDLVMLDNIRVMHGRQPFSDPEREVYTRMCRSVAH